MPNSNPAKSTRMVWLDCLRLMAGVSMVGLHASSDPNGQPFKAFEPIERVGPVLFRAVIYTARTELFLIISLFLLIMSLDRRPRGYLETVSEQARRLLRPFAFWVVFYAFYRLIKASYFGYSDAILGQLSGPESWLGYFILGDVQYHMHFLPTLFGLVLMYPLYRVAVDNPAFGFVVLLCLFTKRELDVWIWSALREMEGFEYLIRTVKLATYSGYGIVAASCYGLYKRGLADAQNRQLAIFTLFVGCLLFSIKLVYSHKVILSGRWEYNFTPAFWADFLMPVILFVGFMALRNRNWPQIISRLAPYSFGIYLVHPIFLDLLEIAFWDLALTPSAFVAYKTVFAISLTSVAVFILSKSNYLAWTVGLGAFPNLPFLRILRSVVR